MALGCRHLLLQQPGMRPDDPWIQQVTHLATSKRIQIRVLSLSPRIWAAAGDGGGGSNPSGSRVLRYSLLHAAAEGGMPLIKGVLALTPAPTPVAPTPTATAAAAAVVPPTPPPLRPSADILDVVMAAVEDVMVGVGAGGTSPLQPTVTLMTAGAASWQACWEVAVVSVRVA